MDEKIDLELKTLLENINSDQDADIAIEKMKEELEFYKSENSEKETLLAKLNLNPENLNLDSQKILDIFVKLQEVSGVAKLETTSIGLAILESEQENHKYQDKIKVVEGQIEYLKQLTQTIDEESKNIDEEINASKLETEKYLPPLDNDLEAINIRIKTYEDKLLEYIKNYPWLEDPEYNLLSIHEEVKKMYELKKEKDGLQKEYDFYEDLKPDLAEAKIQLTKIKAEYDAVCKLIEEETSSK